MRPETRAKDVITEHIAQREVDGALAFTVGDPLVDVVTEAIQAVQSPDSRGRAAALVAALARAGVPDSELGIGDE